MKNRMMTALLTLMLASPALADDIEVSNGWVSGGEAAGKQVVIEALKARGHTWVDASVAGFDNEDAAFSARLQAGDPPGAKFFIAGASGADVVTQGLMMPIDEVVAKNEAALPQLIKDAITIDGHAYFAPLSVHGESWYFYSKPLMEKIGYTEPPTDWDGFFAMLDKAKAAGILPVAFSGQRWQTNKVMNQILVSTMGAENYNKMLRDGDEALVMSPEFLQGVAIFDRLHDYVGTGIATINWNDATAQVIRGEALLQFQGDWAKGEFIAAGQVVGKDYDCAITPGISDMLIVVDSFAFPNVPGNEAAQIALAETLLDPEVQRQFTLLKGAFPARTDVDMSAYDHCAKLGVEKLGANAIAADMAIISTTVVQGQLADLIADFWAAPYDHADFQQDFIAAFSY